MYATRTVHVIKLELSAVMRAHIGLYKMVYGLVNFHILKWILSVSVWTLILCRRSSRESQSASAGLGAPSSYTTIMEGIAIPVRRGVFVMRMAV